MALELRQQLKLTQQLVMTPQLQQAIKLLQLSRLELVTMVEQEMVENPCLEEEPEDESEEVSPEETDLASDEPAEVDAASKDGDAAEAEQDGASSEEAVAEEPTEPEPTAEEMVGDVDWENYMDSRPQTSMAESDDQRPALEDNLTPRPSLADHLNWQLGFEELSDEERELAIRIIGNLSDDGYLEDEIASIAERAGTSLELAERVLARVQQLDPVGVATRSLSECLLVQCRVRGIDDRLVLRIVSDHLDLLQRKDYRGIGRIEGVTIEEVSVAAHVISSLEPRPGREFAQEEPIYITPDIFVHKVGDEYHVVLNEDGMPKLKVSNAYRQVLKNKDDVGKETREYVREKLRGAVWLIKSIHQRQRTIVKVMNSILRFQREFFDKGTEYLRPLNLRDVADDIGMHESTVSRVTTSKYAQTPHGVFGLKFFFNSSIQTSRGDSIASESVKEKIRKIIRAEDPRNPYSDQKISEILRRREITIARRTVTKYREALRILSSTRRRQIG